MVHPKILKFLFFFRHSECVLPCVQLFGFRVYSQFSVAQAAPGEFRIYKRCDLYLYNMVLNMGGALKYLKNSILNNLP